VTVPTDPRAVRSRALIVGAARGLMGESGPESVTFAAVAERAGVGRATVYRHWPTVDALVDEVLDEFSLPFFREPRQPLDQWLHAELRRLADELRTPVVVRMTTSLIGQDLQGPRRGRLFDALEQRLEAALAPAKPPMSPRERASLLIGPLLYLGLGRREAVSDEWIAYLVATALR
jgi:AcrR family transcriptional regulator